MALSYFAENNSGNEQLWITDGTVAGSHVVKVFAGATIFGLTMIGGRVYFAVDDGVHGAELWSSDGTAAGTVLVQDINPGPAGSGPELLINDNGELFFAAADAAHGTELWQSNGTSTGTMLVKDIAPGPTGGFFPFPEAVVNGTVFFAATDGVNGAELWKSDGTAAGTTLVKDINPGGTGSFPQDLINVNGKLFFAATDATHGTELWTSDGTNAGTQLVKDIRPGAVGSVNVGAGLANVNGTVFFSANDGINGSELWKSDGTAAGTVMVANINPGGSSTPNSFTNVNGTLFFFADDGVHGQELWKSDGTAAGTVLVKDIDPGGGAIVPVVGNTVNINGTLFFDATDGVNGPQLWKSDGTAAGTALVKIITPGASAPQQLTNVNGTLEFYAFDGTALGLFRSDGTAAGTIEIATNVDTNTPLGFTAQPASNDLNGDHASDILWRNSAGGLADWSLNGGSITSSGAITLDGTAVNPGATWSIVGISDFNGDGNADVLWRNSADGTLVDWTMNGTTITSSSVLSAGGVAVTPGASWSVIATGDFDGDTRADVLWRNTDGTVVEWTLNGSSITSSGPVTSGGVAVKADSSWSVAGVGDFNGDNKRDVLWRNTDGTLVEWTMNGSTISSSATVTAGGFPIKPDASWSVAGIGDFNGDGNSDILWRNTNGSLVEWQMNGASITSSAPITLDGTPLTPNATWHVVEIGDFNGDGQSDILWRNDNGAVAEWLLNGTTVVSSVIPNVGGTAATPDATWSTQAKPTNFG
jgi:ELWxxDGT repeat protein